MASTRPFTVPEGTQRHPLPANGTAAVLAIGTSNPVNCIHQNEYTDWYFRVTKSDHLAKLKDKMRRICEKSGIGKRYFLQTEEIIDGHPEFLDGSQLSLRTRLGIASDAMPELAAAAAAKAIAEWGRPATDITHLIVGTSSGTGSPGVDVRLAALLGLRPTVQRTLLNLQGCAAGSIALRHARDLAENNLGARVLVVCVDVITMVSFRAPDETNIGGLVAMSLFGDGAGAAIVGSGPMSRGEHPIFHMVSVSQATLPGTDNAVGIKVSERGLDLSISVKLPKLVGDSIKRCLEDTLAPLGLENEWNGLFWVAHPGGRAILDCYQAAFDLEPGKLAASRSVLREYGNMFGATTFFVLDEMHRRRRSGNEEERENCEWGVMMGLSPGVTVEMMVLHAQGNKDED